MSKQRGTVLHVTPYMHPAAGGPPVVVDRLCRKLVSGGWPVEVITTDQFAASLDRQWVRNYAEAYPIQVLSVGKLSKWRRGEAEFAVVEEAVSRARIVHLHGLWSRLNRLAGTYCRRHGVPYMVMPHGMLDPHSLARKRFKKKLFGALIEWPHLRRASGMVYTHAEERRLAESEVKGLPPGHVVSLATDPPPEIERGQLAEQFYGEFPHLRDKKLVVFLSRLHEKKGLDLLLPAFSNVLRQNPEAHLLLVGHGDERYVELLRKQAHDLHLDDNITFAGSRAGIAKWSALAAGDVFVLPSYQENFAIVVAEAMAMGLPVVLSGRVNICGDVVAAGAGLECDLHPRSIADKLIQYIVAPDVAQSSGECGRALVRDSYTWERSAAAMERVYGQILAPAAECPVLPIVPGSA